MDAFAQFGVPRKLLLDQEEVDLAIREVLRNAHPDVGGSDSEFAALKKSAILLGSHSGRLRLALQSIPGESGSRGNIPGEVMDLFSPVAGILEKVNQFVTARNKAVSGLGRAVLDVAVPDLKRELEELIAEIGMVEAGFQGRFEAFDQNGWEACRQEMEEVSRAFTFLNKWQGQLKEATGRIFEALLAG